MDSLIILYSNLLDYSEEFGGSRRKYIHILYVLNE